MDLQQQIFLNAWLNNRRSPQQQQQQQSLLLLPSINSSQQFNNNFISSSSPYNNNTNQSQQQLIIQNSSSNNNNNNNIIFDQSSSSSTIIDNNNQFIISQIPSSLNSSKIILPISSSSPQQYINNNNNNNNQQKLDHLLAIATFQQMIEKIKSSEIAKANEINNNNLLFYSNNNNGELSSSSAFKLINPPIIQQNTTDKINFSSSYILSEEYQKQKEIKQLNLKNELKQQQYFNNKNNLNNNFLPKPSTSANEFLEQALIKLLRQQNGTTGETIIENNQTNITINEEGNNNNQTQLLDYNIITAGEEIILCKVCSDRASGFHYGIFSCEGCKGFFRRSLQNKIDYRPCTQNQKCQIVRANRNRCQECRWRKCIEAGMSKDGVRYGRVPKREKEKLREEMRRDSVRSVLEHLSIELNDSDRLLEKLEKGWNDLENDLLIILKKQINKKEEEEEKLIDVNKLCLLAKAVIRFAETIGGFRLLRIDDQVKVLKESLYPILLLRFCSLRHLFDKQLYFDLANIPFALLLSSSSFSALRECTIEFIIRIREANSPIELSLNNKQLAICAAISLCRLEGAGECASGSITTNTATTSNNNNAWEEQLDQLGQAVCRRIKEKYYKLLNSSLGVLSSEQQPIQTICTFGPSPLRTDLLIRQNLASVFERLKHCRDLYLKFLNANTCKNIPLELFSIEENEKKSSIILEINRKRKNLENDEEKIIKLNKFKKNNEKNIIKNKEYKKEEEEEDIQIVEKINKINNNNNNETIQQELKKQDMPILRRVLEQKTFPIITTTINNNNLNKSSSPSSLSSHQLIIEKSSSLISILNINNNLNNQEDDEQPLNLCLRDNLK